MKLTIHTPEEIVFEKDIDGIHLATEAGELVVKDDHAPLFAVIDYTHAEIAYGEHTDVYIMRRGIMHMDAKNNELSILVSYAGVESKEDEVSAQEYLEYIKEQIQKGEEMTDFHLKYLEHEKFTLERAVEKRKRG